MKNKALNLLLSATIYGVVMSSCHHSGEVQSQGASSQDSILPKDTAIKVAVDSAIEVKHDTVPSAAVDVPTKPPLTIIVDKLRSPDAPIVMGLYGTGNKFPDPKDQLKEYHFIPKDGKLVAHISDIQYGEFALAIYQDVNSNGKIDKNGIGIPTEPYAFSNNYKPVIKAPSFKDCKFEYNKTSNTINISLLH